MEEGVVAERVVLVTGAGSGIGAAVARRVAGPGTRLVLHSGRNREGLEAVAAGARADGSDVETALGDLAEEVTAGRLVEAAVGRFGRLDQIVSNAGFADRRLFGDLDEAGLKRSESTIAGAFFRLVSAALPQLRASDWARVVAVSSFAAHVFDAKGNLFPASAAAKAAMEALARSLAAQLAPEGIPVNCVVPGYTRKEGAGHSALSAEGWRRIAERIPMGRLAEPAEIAHAVAFLLGREAGYITGQLIHVDGGLTLP